MDFQPILAKLLAQYATYSQRYNHQSYNSADLPQGVLKWELQDSEPQVYGLLFGKNLSFVDQPHNSNCTIQIAASDLESIIIAKENPQSLCHQGRLLIFGDTNLAIFALQLLHEVIAKNSLMSEFN